MQAAIPYLQKNLQSFFDCGNDKKLVSEEVTKWGFCYFGENDI